MGAISLIFAPHPDDETFGCGGLIASRTASGQVVYVTYITDGAASHPGHPEITPARLASIRAHEAQSAAAVLGVPSANLIFLNVPDGQLPHLSTEVRADLVHRVRQLIERIQPAEIFITAAADGSTEHTAANRVVRDALISLAAPQPRVVEYPVWSRWNPLLLRKAIQGVQKIYIHALTPAELARKRTAMGAHRSQVEPLPPWPQPVLSAEFVAFFDNRIEFFFEA